MVTVARSVRIACSLLVVVVACGDSGTKGSGDTSVSGDGTTTTPTDGTATGDTGDDATPTETVCTSNEQCTESGAVCSCDGTCVVPTGKACTEDKNCGVPNWCNPCTGHCEPQADLCETCSDTRGCVDGGACLPFAAGGTYCARACVTGAGCPQGFDCQDVGVEEKQCIPQTGTCADLGLCEGDTECPIDQVCSDATKTCAPGCSEDGQCPGGGTQVCVLGRCGPKCDSNDDCDSPAQCQENGHCKVPGSCEAAIDCPTPETYCDRESGTCKPGCQQDGDCKDAAKVCQNGSCAPKGCQHNYECAFGKVCDKSNGSCVAYPASEPHCAVCDASAETNASCPDPNLCVTFKDQNDVEQGDFCLATCKDDPIDRCPSGWQCNKFESEDGSDVRYLCVRQCWVNPVGN